MRPLPLRNPGLNALLALVGTTALGQPPTAARFEVATVKPCAASAAVGRTAGGETPSLDRIHLGCQTLMSVIRWSYGHFAAARFNPFPSATISGGPAWINTDVYEITAKAESRQPWGVLNGPMLRSLLEERFQLKTHRESREVPVYALIVGKGGSKLKPTGASACTPFDTTSPPAPPEPDKPLPNVCGVSRVTTRGFDLSGTIADFAISLSNYADRKVIDRTGISGTFDIHLDLAARDVGLGAAPNALDTPAKPDAADIFSTIRDAVQKLGLRLESAKGASEVIIIDRAEKPSQN